MRVPLSWLREYAPLPEPVDAIEVSRRLTAAGLEVESLEPVGHDIRGVVVAEVLSIEELPGLKKPIRYCSATSSPWRNSRPCGPRSSCPSAGDQLARVALTLLVFRQTHSALLAAATFAASSVPMFVGGLTLSPLADRLPRQAGHDRLRPGARAGLVTIMAMPGLP